MAAALPRAAVLGAVLAGLLLIPARAGAAELVAAEVERMSAFAVDLEDGSREDTIGPVLFDDQFSEAFTFSGSGCGSVSTNGAISLDTSLGFDGTELTSISTESTAHAEGGVDPIVDEEDPCIGSSDAGADLTQTIEFETGNEPSMRLSGSIAATGTYPDDLVFDPAPCQFVRVHVEGALSGGERTFRVALDPERCNPASTPHEPNQLAIDEQYGLGSGTVSIEVSSLIYATGNKDTPLSATDSSFELEVVLGPAVEACTITVANPGLTTLGTEEDDVICGTDGADEIIGLGGDDVIVGRGGDDRLSGALGDDRLLGEGGEDEIFGGFGEDEIHGGADSDPVLHGNQDDDLIFGEGGNDGDLPTEAGDEALVAGGHGNDFIEGGPGADAIAGGCGEDTHFPASCANDIVPDNADRDTLIGGDGVDGIFGDAQNDDIDGGDGDDFLAGGAGSDFIDGGPGDEIVAGGAGIVGGSGRDRLRGGGGDDLIEGQGDRDFILGQGGLDKLRGGGGRDCIAGGSSKDVIVGGAGNDRLDAKGGGRDKVNGNGGRNDKARVDSGDNVTGVEDLSPPPIDCAP